MSTKGFSVGGNIERYDYNSLDNLPSEITIDPALSGSSTNPVQNKVVTGAINATTDSVNALSGEVSGLKSAISFFDDIPGTVQTVNFDANGTPSSIVHTANGEAVRTDSFTWADNTVTEKRELADGSYITFVTNLTTLVTTISEIQEA